MSKIKSNYLKTEFSVDLFEKLDDFGGALKIIRHASLEDIIVNQLDDVFFDYEIIKADKDHSVIKCIISDKKGRRVVDVGESLPATLTTEIAQNYPVLTASQRAFDRAAIKYLNIPGKIYSDLEIPEEFKNQEDTSKKVEKEQSTSIKSKTEKTDDSSAPKNAEIKSQKENKNETESDNSDLEVRDPGQGKMTKGRAKGKTIAETFEKDISSIHWVLNNLASSTNAEVVAMLRDINDYMLLNSEAKEAYEAFKVA